MVQSVERAFAILEAVAQRPAGITALADRLDLPKSTVARLLSSLEQLGAVERLDGRRWRVGPAVEAFARTVPPERSLAALARPTLADLVRSVGEDAGLGLPDGCEVLYIDQVECDHPVQVRDWTGTRAPLHAVPSGLVFMADWPEDAVDAYVARG
ncbi:MAG: helix-turn-helix domain-containing protein, partial [Actinomycetota bacterium]|nr:helix-turn-helix domain-containing protein [Actinomycetota bacterium]